MKRNFRRRLNCVLPLLLAVLIVAGCAMGTGGSTGNTGAAFTDVTGQFSDAFSALMKENFSSSVMEGTAKYETRTVLISLSEKSLTDYAGKESVASYASSEKGKEKTQKIYAQQDKILEKLKEAGIEYELEYRYVAVDNAVAVTIDTSNVAQIKKMSGVDGVVISRSYAAPKSVDTYGNAGSAVVNATNVYKTGVYDSSNAISKGYDGSGMVVAILDTGLDYKHSAFANMPNGTYDSKFTKEYIANVLATKDLSSESFYDGTLTVDDVYYNEKVPFMFDYADKDPNVYPSYSNHGTHVAGIIAGHDKNGYTDADGNHIDEEFWGVAPEAQLVICKVFTDELESNDLGGAVTEDILAALEDCILLGVDVINMSLGTTCGFATTDDGDDEGEYLNRVYDAVGKAGISLICAASNDYSSAYGGTFGTNLSTNPDSGTVGSPSTFASALSVASISGKTSSYLMANGETVVFFQNSNDANSNPFDFVEDMLGENETHKEYEYVVIPGVGLASDYTASIQEKVQGRIALVKRGDSTFQEKVELAMQFGAVGIIVYNNVAGDIRMTLGDIDDPIPAISIDMEAGEKLVEEAGSGRIGKLKINTKYTAGPFMSDFSSWGATSDLKLKPEITAHGGEITSTVPGGYTEMSGTSMATPNMAGVVALVRCYIETSNIDLDVHRYNDENGDPETDAVVINRLVNQLLMSTATTVYDEKDLPYSPRKQGAGLGSLDNAMSTMAYLWTEVKDNDCRPKYELGDDPNQKGVYTIPFKMTNFSGGDLVFTTNTLFMTETLAVDGLAVAEQAHMLTDIAPEWVIDGESYAEGAEVTLSEGEHTIVLTVKLSDAEKEYINTNFKNGMFVEGFAKLLSKTEGQCDLVLPFMGFFGDWSKAPMLDYDAYYLAQAEKDSSIADDEKPQASIWATQPYVTYWNDQYTLPMGSYLYLQDPNVDQILADMEHNVISCYNQYMGDDSVDNYLTSYKFQGLYAGLLRSARSVDYRLINTNTGEVLEEDTIYRVGKAYASGGSTVPGFVKFDTDPLELGLVSGENYTMQFEFYLDYENEDGTRAHESYEFSFYADYEAPVLEDVRVRYYEYKDGNTVKQKIYLDLDVFDNTYAQSVMLTYLDGDVLKMATSYLTPVLNANKNGTTTVSIDITDIYENYKDLLYVQLDDYALNHSQYWLNLSNANMNLAPETFELADGEESIELDKYESHTVSLIYSGDGNLSNFSWSSNNTAVAIVKNGEIVGLSTGKATITVTGKDGCRRSIEVTVTENEVDLSIPSISFGSMVDSSDAITRASSVVSKYPGDEFKLEIKTDPWYYPTDKLQLKWESTNEKVATVDQNGNVTVLAEGSAVIKAIIVVNEKPTAYTATMTIKALDPFEMNGYYLTAYHGKEKNVVIPEDLNVMMISEDAFKDNDTMETIVIPKTVMQIGKNAFENCSALREVYFEDTGDVADCDISIIFQEAFKNCKNLEKVDLTSVKIVTLGRECFAGCSSLKEIVALNKATTLSDGVFADCTSLDNIDLSGLYVCGTGVFSGCTGLTTVHTTSDTNLGDYTFLNCTGLKKITLSAGQIGNYAFAGCTKLTSVTFAPAEGEDSLSASIGSYAFAGVESLTKVTFDEKTTIWSIGDGAFKGTRLSGFTMPSGLTVLGKDILEGTTVKQIVISDDVDFETIRLSGLLTSSVNLKLAEDCTAYKLVNGVLYNSDMTKLLFVEVGTTEVEIPESVTAIGDYAFAGSNVSKVKIPAGVTSIGVGAFQESGLTSIEFAQDCTIEEIADYTFNDTKLQNITIPASVKSIGAYAFASSNIASVSFAGDEVSYIGDRAFSDCNRLVKINLIDGISEMGDGVFYGCMQLTTVTMPSVQKLGLQTFYGCSKLKSVTFGENATTLGDDETVIIDTETDPVILSANTFYGCSALESVSFGEQITQINGGVFYGCTALKTIDLKNVTAIGEQAFAKCDALSTVTGLEKVETIGDYAFYNCNSISKLNLASAKTIGNYAFAIENGGKAYTEISIPVAESIGNMAFYGGMEAQVNIPASLKKLGYGAFAYSKKLTTITVSDENKTFYVEDGVLFSNLPSGGIELCCYPGAMSDGSAYTIPDGTTRVAGYAFAGLKKSPEKVVLPWSMDVIGVSAFYDSGIRTYEFHSINAPVLGVEYRADVIEKMTNASTGMEVGAATVNGLFYANFNTLMVNYTTMLGGEISDMSISYPTNGVGYDNYVWNTYFGTRSTLGILMDDDTRAALEAIEALEDLQTIEQWLKLENNAENKEMVTAFADRVKEARRLYNNVTDKTQLSFISDEGLDEKLAQTEELTRSLKEKFGISVKIQKITYNDDYKKQYVAGETFSMEGLELTIVYDDYSTEKVDMSKVTVVSPTGALGIYNWTVTLSYEGETVEIPITVSAANNSGDNNEQPGDDPSVEPEDPSNNTKPAEKNDSNIWLIVVIVASVVVVAGAAVVTVVLLKRKKSAGSESPKERRHLNSTVIWWIVAVIVVIGVIVVGNLLSDGDNDGADVKAYINYHANGGEFDDHSNEKNIGYASNSFPLNIQHKNNITKGNVAINERTGYTFLGWYMPMYDENGELVYEDEAKTIVQLGEAYDFNRRLADDTEIDLYAKWQKNVYVSVLLAGDAIKDETGKAYAVGDEIKELNFESGSVAKTSGSRLVSLKRGAYTFVEYYYDEDCTQIVSWPIVEQEGTESYTIYAKFIEGDWEIVSNADSAAKMLAALNAESNYYVTCDIDLNGKVINTANTVKATVKGNGYTLSNFTVEKKNQKDDTSAFGDVKSNAGIFNLNLKNMKVDISIQSGAPNVYFLFKSVEKGATFSDLAVSGTMTVKYNTDSSIYIQNIQHNLHDTWIIGGENQTALTDGTITVKAECSINGNEQYSYPSN